MQNLFEKTVGMESLKIAQIIQSNNEFKDDKIIDLRVSNHVITSND